MVCDIMKCPDCEQTIDSDRFDCPHCGADLGFTGGAVYR